METYCGLYYPFIHFKNDNWLKIAALYWDRMGRIVPYSYTTEDSDTVRALGNFIETLRPDWVRPQFGEAFAEFVQEYGKTLRDRYGVDHVDTWDVVLPARRPPYAGGASGLDPRLGYVFFEKMSNDLTKIFVGSGLARFDSTGDGRWIGMHPNLALVYMTAMADQMAGERGLAPIADNSVDHIAASGCTVERLAQALLSDVTLVDDKANMREVETDAALVALETVVPRNPTALPVDKILKFRDKYPSERAIFQQWVTGFVNDRAWLQEMRDHDIIEERIRDEYKTTLQPKIVELKEKLEEIGIETVRGCMNVKALLPSVVPKAAALAGFSLEPITATGAAIALSLVPILQDKRKKYKGTLSTSKVTYLLRAEEELNPGSVMRDVKLALRRFCLGA